MTANASLASIATDLASLTSKLIPEVRNSIQENSLKVDALSVQTVAAAAVSEPVVRVIREPVYAYDAQNRLSTITFTGGVKTFTYDASGKLATVFDSQTNLTQTITYNANDSVNKITNS